MTCSSVIRAEGHERCEAAGLSGHHTNGAVSCNPDYVLPIDLEGGLPDGTLAAPDSLANIKPRKLFMAVVLGHLLHHTTVHGC